MHVVCNYSILTGIWKETVADSRFRKGADYRIGGGLRHGWVQGESMEAVKWRKPPQNGRQCAEPQKLKTYLIAMQRFNHFYTFSKFHAFYPLHGGRRQIPRQREGRPPGTLHEFANGNKRSGLISTLRSSKFSPGEQMKFTTINNPTN